jgi:flagellar basal-body rod protein FlgF
MDRLVFTSHATINEQAVVRQTLTNELANVSTVGFKRSYDIALRAVKSEGDGFDTRYQTQAIARDIIRLSPGPVMVTGRPLDIAMTNNSVLGVQAPNGELAFSRRGDLRVSAQGQLEDGLGRMVMGADGPLAVPPGLQVSINPDGSVYATDPAQPGVAASVLIGQLMLRDASNTPLMRREDGLFRVVNQPPGADIAPGPNLPEVIPNTLEGSSVSAVEAMTRLMDHSRTFEAQIRVIKEAKSLDESGASMMKNA